MLVLCCAVWCCAGAVQCCAGAVQCCIGTVQRCAGAVQCCAGAVQCCAGAVQCCAGAAQCCAGAVEYHAISKCEWLYLEEEPNIIEEIVTITKPKYVGWAVLGENESRKRRLFI